MTSLIVQNRYVGRERPVDLSGDVELAYELVQRGDTYQASALYKQVFEARFSEDIDTEPLDKKHVTMFVKTGMLLNRAKRNRRGQ